MMTKLVSVLLVEDDEDYASLLVRRLTTSNEQTLLLQCTVTHVITLAEAIAYLREHPVDAILLDIALPDANGLNTVAAMQAAAPATAIVVLTALTDAALTAQALQTGVEDYLIKGEFNQAMLIRSLWYAVDRKQSRNALLASEHRYRSLIENASDMVIIVKATFTLAYASPSIRTLLGYPPEEALEHNLLDFIHPDDLATVQSAFAAAQQAPNASIQVSHVRVRRADDAWRIISAILTNLLDDASVQGIVINARDVTEQKLAEEIVRKTQRLESLGLLAKSFVHDFNNLLTNILAQNTLALTRLPTESPARIHINKSNSAVRMAADLTRQLLAYTDKGYTQVEAVDINALLLENVALFKASLGQAIELALALAERLPTVDGNPAQLQQAILNLVINAAEAIHPAAGQVTLTTRLATLTLDAEDHQLDTPLPAGPCVMLEVSDTGRGMDDTTRAHLFEPFFSTKPHGHGLGLAATLGILRAHRGAVQVASMPGQGTQVRLLFPPGKLQPPLEGSFEQNPALFNTVLLIEDEKFLLESLSDLLGAAGLQTLTALHGRQGVELFKQYQDKIGVVVLDMKMPLMDGTETLRQLLMFDPEVEVIIASAYAIPEEVKPLIEHRKISLIAKPFEIDYLLSKIVNTIMRHQHGQ